MSSLPKGISPSSPLDMISVVDAATGRNEVIRLMDIPGVNIDGVTERIINPPWAGRKPNLAGAGNSIFAYNCYGGWGNTGADKRSNLNNGFVHWLRMLSGQAFGYTRSFPVPDRTLPFNSQQLQTAWSALVKYTLGDIVTSGGNSYWCAAAGSLNQDPAVPANQVWGTGGSLTSPWVPIPSNSVANSVANWTINSGGNGVELLDHTGLYGAPSNTSTQILQRLRSPSFYRRFIDTPDIFWLANFFENSTVSGGYTLNSLLSELDSAISALQNYWPNVIVIVGTPGPSENNNSIPGNRQLQQSVRSYLLDSYSRKNVLIERNDSWYLGDPSLGQFDARFGEVYSPDGISANGWFFNGVSGATNIHPGVLGGIVRAKSFLAQFGYLTNQADAVPPGTGILNDTTKVISDDGAGNGTAFLPIFGFNPDLSQTGTSSGVATNNSYIRADNAGTNVIATPTQRNDGLEFAFGSSGALPGAIGAKGAANTLLSNGIEVGTRWGIARTIDMSVYGATNLFNLYAIIEVVDPSNLFCFDLELYNATRNAWTDGAQREYHPIRGTRVGGGLMDVPGCLQAGDILTIKLPFGFGNNPDLSGISLKVYQGPSGVAYTGPVLKIKRLQVMRNSRTHWAG